jgi:UrcA family protein
MPTLRTCIAAFAVATVVSSTAVAKPSADEQVATRTVKVWDLDLAESADVQTLYDRVHAAAAHVCRAEERRAYRVARMRVPAGWLDRCVNGAIDGAVREIGNPNLRSVRTRSQFD